MTKQDLIREDPPPIRHRRARRGLWAEVYDELQKTPGEWHRVDKHYDNVKLASAAAHYVKSNYAGVRASVRSDENGTVLYVCYEDAS